MSDHHAKVQKPLKLRLNASIDMPPKRKASSIAADGRQDTGESGGMVDQYQSGHSNASSDLNDDAPANVQLSARQKLAIAKQKQLLKQHGTHEAPPGHPRRQESWQQELVGSRLQDQHIQRSEKVGALKLYRKNDKAARQPDEGQGGSTLANQIPLPELKRKGEITRPLHIRPQKQEFWLQITVRDAFVPNGVVDYSQQMHQAYLKVSLLDHTSAGFVPLAKADRDALSSIQHENVTNMRARSTGQADAIVSLTTQPQEIYANSQFYEHLSPEKPAADAPDDDLGPQDRLGDDYFFLNALNFPIGNSAVVKFAQEKLVFNDKQDNVVQRAYIFAELLQLPTWKQGRSRVLGWGCVRLSELIRREGEYFNMTLFKPLKGNDYQRELVRIFAVRPCDGYMDTIDVNDAQQIAQTFRPRKVYQPKKIGLVQLKYKFISGDKIIPERLVKRRPVYPYDVEQNAADVENEKQTERKELEQIDYSKFDIKSKQHLDELHQLSLQFGTLSGNPTTFNTQNINASAFMSNCTSAAATAPTGNVCLGAAAVLCDSDVFNVVLFNIATGQLLALLGTHYGYVYRLAFTHDARHLLSCSADGRVMIFTVQQYSYYGFHFYFGKNQREANRLLEVVQKKRKGSGKLNDDEQELFSQFQHFVSKEVNTPRNLLLYQFGDIRNDLTALEILSSLAMETSGDLNKLLVNISPMAMQETQARHLYYQIDQGVCIYDTAQINYKHQSFLSPTQIGALHDITAPRPFIPISMQMATGNLTGQVTYIRIAQLEQGRPVSLTQQAISQHEEYVNCVKAQQLKTYTMIVTADANGSVRFIKLQVNPDQSIKFTLQTEIQTQIGLRDFAILRTRSKELRIVTINSFYSVQIFDTTGQLLCNVNEEVQDYNKNLAAREQVSMRIQKLQLPGSCRLCTDPNMQFCYVPSYGGGVFCISPSGRVVQQFYFFDQQIQYGCFISQLLYTASGLLACCTTIAEENKQILAGFLPAGIPRYNELPVMIAGCSHQLQQKEFRSGYVVDVKGEDEVKIDGDNVNLHGSLGVADVDQVREGTVARQTDEGVDKTVSDFLKFIRDQRQQMTGVDKAQ